MSMNAYPISHYRIESELLVPIQSLIDEIHQVRIVTGVTDEGFTSYLRYGEEFTELRDSITKESIAEVLEVLSTPQENLPKFFNGDDSTQGVIAEMILGGKEISGPIELLKNGETEPLAEYFEEELIKIQKRIDEALGIAIYPYSDENHELQWGITMEQLFIDSPAHKALKEKSGMASVITEDAWEEWG
jgi:hypothetical protein